MFTYHIDDMHSILLELTLFSAEAMIFLVKSLLSMFVLMVVIRFSMFGKSRGTVFKNL